MASPADYSGKDLRGCSFRGQSLDGANFERADVRGADFSGSHLAGASFRGARIGVRPLVGASVLGLSLILCLAAGVAIGYFASDVRDRVGDSNWDGVAGGISMIVVTVVFVVALLFPGVSRAFRIAASVLALAIVGNVVANYIWDDVDVDSLLSGLGLLLGFALAVLTGVLGRVVGGTFGAWSIAIVALLGGLAAGRAHGGLAAVVVSVLLVLISKRALRADPRYQPLRKFAHRIVSRRGTRFSGADLTAVDFTGSHLLHSDVEGAMLDGATWDEGKGPFLSAGVISDTSGNDPSENEISENPSKGENNGR